MLFSRKTWSFPYIYIYVYICHAISTNFLTLLCTLFYTFSLYVIPLANTRLVVPGCKKSQDYSTYVLKQLVITTWKCMFHSKSQSLTLKKSKLSSLPPQILFPEWLCLTWCGVTAIWWQRRSSTHPPSSATYGTVFWRRNATPTSFSRKRSICTESAVHCRLVHYFWDIFLCHEFSLNSHVRMPDRDRDWVDAHHYMCEDSLLNHKCPVCSVRD